MLAERLCGGRPSGARQGQAKGGGRRTVDRNLKLPLGSAAPFHGLDGQEVEGPGHELLAGRQDPLQGEVPGPVVARPVQLRGARRPKGEGGTGRPGEDEGARLRRDEGGGALDFRGPGDGALK